MLNCVDNNAIAYYNNRMDIKIKDTENKQKFYSRTCGIIKQEDKFLIMRVNKTVHYHIPGGHIEIGEDSKTAVIREIKEEVGCDVRVKNLISINENFFERKETKFHGVEFYYLLEPTKPLEMKDYSTTEIDKGKTLELDFKWVTKEELKQIDLRPDNLKELILNDGIYEFTHNIKNDMLEN